MKEKERQKKTRNILNLAHGSLTSNGRSFLTLTEVGCKRSHGFQEFLVWQSSSAQERAWKFFSPRTHYIRRYKERNIISSKYIVRFKFYSHGEIENEELKSTHRFFSVANQCLFGRRYPPQIFGFNYEAQKTSIQSNLDYPDLDYLDFSIVRTCFSGRVFFMNINKMWSWKIEATKSSLILPNVCLNSRFLICFALKSASGTR